MQGKIKNKLISTNGESLAEVLVAALIGGLALLMLATMIMAATRMVQNSNTKIESIYRDMALVDAQGETKASSDETAQQETGTVSIAVEQKSSYSTSDNVGVKVYSSNKIASYITK